MRQKSFKNYIAFTLMEMTLVLLITSIIAAAATPIITSAVSDSAAKGGKDTLDFYANAWRTSNSYNGGGIYSIPLSYGSFIGINVKPGAYANAYQYPTLLIASNSTNNIVRNPQIIIENVDTPNNGSIDSNNKTHALKIGMDEYENILMLSGNSFSNVNYPAYNALNIGYKSIYIGNDIQKDVSESKLGAGNSIFIGSDISAYYASNVINIGSNIKRFLDEQYVVNIGYGLYGYNSNGYSSIDNVNIGRYANSYGMGRYNVIMGKYAGYATNAMRNVILGNYSGTHMKSDYYRNYDNVIIGYYALNRPQNNSSHPYYGNVVIGRYANSIVIVNNSSSLNTTFSSIYFDKAVVLGSYAGAYKNLTGGVATHFNSVLIGDYAGMYSFGSQTSDAIHRPNTVMIGNYAGYNSSNASGSNIFIGAYSGQNSKSFNSVYIGEYAGMNTSAASSDNTVNIAIGYYAGYGSGYSNNIYIGSYAGYSARGGYNVGIGEKACQRLESAATKKWCLGYGVLMSAVSDTSNINVWSNANAAAQMVIGFTDEQPVNQNAVLYAYNVYRWNSTSIDKVSDRRFKTNIVPSNRSIKDIRKINIYEYNFKADKNKSPKIGVIAQEYKKVFPNDVVRDEATKKLVLSVDWMIYTMVNAVKDVDNTIKSLQKEAKIYINDFSDLKTRIVNLEKQAQQIRAENEEIKAHLARVNKQLR